jgi:uncharacterized OB-fold protein
VPLPTFAPPGWAPVQPFWDGLLAGELRLPRCGLCGMFMWYPDETGPHCAGAETVWETLPGSGTVYTHTTVRRAFAPSTEPDVLPVVIVLVEPDGAPGVRIVGNLVGGDPVVGQRVELHVVDRAEGGSQPHPVFVPEPGGPNTGA